MMFPNAIWKSICDATAGISKFIFNADKELSEEAIIRRVYIAIILTTQEEDKLVVKLEKLKVKAKAILSEDEYKKLKISFLSSFKINENLSGLEKEILTFEQLIKVLDVDLSKIHRYQDKFKKINKKKYSKHIRRLYGIEKYISYKGEMDASKSLYELSISNEKRLRSIEKIKNKKNDDERIAFSKQLASFENRPTEVKLKALIAALNDFNITNRDIEKGEFKYLSKIVKSVCEKISKENNYGSYIKEIISVGFKKVSDFNKAYIFNIMYSITHLKLGVYSYEKCVKSFFDEINEDVHFDFVKNNSIVLSILSYAKDKAEKDQFKATEWNNIYKIISEKIPLEFYVKMSNDESCLRMLEENK